MCGFILLLGNFTRSGFLCELTRSGLSDVWDTFILPAVVEFNLMRLTSDQSNLSLIEAAVELLLLIESMTLLYIYIRLCIGYYYFCHSELPLLKYNRMKDPSSTASSKLSHYYYYYYALLQLDFRLCTLTLFFQVLY